jgi:hypothetical protein
MEDMKSADIDVVARTLLRLTRAVTKQVDADIWNVNREKELILSREEVLSSWINHFLKKESLEKMELMCKIKKSMDLFELSIDFLDNVIVDMCNKKYIKYNQEKLEKIIW